MTAHFVERCRCGVVVSQCRCPSPDKQQRVSSAPCTHAPVTDTTLAERLAEVLQPMLRRTGVFQDRDGPCPAYIVANESTAECVLLDELRPAVLAFIEKVMRETIEECASEVTAWHGTRQIVDAIRALKEKP